MTSTAFQQWQQTIIAAHDARQFARAWAWIASDSGDDDLAADILDVTVTDDDTEARLRLAEVLYARARSNDLTRAEQIYRRVLQDATYPSARDTARLRIADLARKTMPTAAPLRKSVHVAQMVTQPAVVLVSTRFGRLRTESAADAYRSLGQSILRTGEVLAARSPTALWPVLGIALLAGAQASGRAERLAANGNRRALTRQHRLTAVALASVLRRHRVPDVVVKELKDLRNVYTNAGDFPGAGNCSLALAVAAMPDSRDEVDRLLRQAYDDHCHGRPDHSVLPSAEHLAQVVRVIADKHAAPPRTGA